MELTDERIRRYSRQILLKEIGGTGQKKMLAATVGVIGAGGLGCPAVQVLASTGVGNLRIFDGDKVELSNLPRQMMFTTADVGRPKVDAMRDRIRAMNPDVNVWTSSENITRDNIDRALVGCEYVIEASDNFATKFLVNDACVHHKIPFTIAGVVKFTGQILSVRPGSGPCYRCVFGEPIPDDESNNCAAVGVIGTNPALAGTLQANEAIKSILGLDTRFMGQVFLFDLLDDTFEWVSLKRNPSCKACSDPSIPYYKTALYRSGGDSCTT